MRVMSFNIRGSFHDDGDNDWPKRRDLNIATIQKYNPDIIGFQEAQSGNLADYANELPEYAYNLGPVAVRKADDHHHVPIFWRRERYALVNSGGFYLSETPDVWSIGWGATFARSANWVTLLDMQTNQCVARPQTCANGQLLNTDTNTCVSICDTASGGGRRMNSAPCAKLTTPNVPKISVSPRAISA
mgnify:CR=1 FL=1